MEYTNKILMCILVATAILAPDKALGQRNEIFSEDIRSLQVIAGNRWMDIPVVSLRGNEAIHISFDDMTHEYRRYTYKIEHCEADWTTSEELLASDFVEGFSEGNTIEDLQESLNTTMLYTHYSLQIPNDKCRVKMSGNYRLTICDDNDDERPVLSACFMVKEEAMGVKMSVETNTDVDINESHQQVEMTVDYGSLPVIRPDEQVKTVVMQNGRWDNARVNVKPQFVKSDGLRWSHCRDLIFSAGNEFRKYEILDVTHPTMGIDKIEWDGEAYHVFPFTDEPRPNYIYDEDANGAFYIRNSDNIGNDYLSEYVYVHYILNCPKRQNGDVYIYGKWTNDRFLPEYEMNYNETEKRYEATVLQKQGYYNYQYLLMTPEGNLVSMPTEGDFYQTENSYQVLVYYREAGGRTDRLVGYQQVTYK